MLHFSTRPNRVRMLTELGVFGVSLDSLTDGLGARIVRTWPLWVGMGVRAAFGELSKCLRGFEELHPKTHSSDRDGIRRGKEATR